MLQGRSEATMTADWRMPIPERLRELFTPSRLITKGDDGCWCVHLTEDPLGNDTVEAGGRSTRYRVAIDEDGYLTIPPPLRDWGRVNVPFAAMLIGMGDCAEIWPASTLQVLEEQNRPAQPPE